MNKSKSVVVLGKFDGVHIAHAKLITTAVDIASERGAVSLVYSMQKSDSAVITEQKIKKDIITKLGADVVVFKELDHGFMTLSAEEFVKDIIAKELNACCVVVGENFRFGKNRSAGVCELKGICSTLNIDVVVIDTVHIGDETVSSTFVKTLLSKGEVGVVAQYLGRVFTLTGIVTEGKHLGRNLGFPTANLYPPASCLVPLNGVYATRVIHQGQIYPSITNVGVNPTVEEGKNIKVETHVFASVGNWYGEEITVEFCEFIRSEIRFDNMSALKSQMEKDKAKAKEFHNII